MKEKSIVRLRETEIARRSSWIVLSSGWKKSSHPLKVLLYMEEGGEGKKVKMATKNAGLKPALFSSTLSHKWSQRDFSDVDTQGWSSIEVGLSLRLVA